MKETAAPGARQIWRKGGGVLVVQVLGIGVSVLVPVVLARTLGAAGFGLYATVLALVQVLTRIPSLGLDTGLLRYIPSYTATARWGELRGLLRTSSGLVGVGSLVAGAVLAATAFALGPRIEAATRDNLAAGGILLATLAMLNTVVAGLRAVKRPVRAQLLDGVLRPAALAGIVLTISLLPDQPITSVRTLVAHGLVTLALVGLGAHWLTRALPAARHTTPARYELRTWLRTSTPMLATGLLQALLRQMDILYVGLLTSPGDAGLYAVASRLSRLVVLGQTASNTIGAPIIAELHAADRRDELGRIARVTCLGAVAAGGAVAAVLGIGHELILGVFGPAFTSAAPVLGILIAGQLINVSAGPVGYLLNLTGQQDRLTRLTFALSLGAAVALPIGIHVGGIQGAAVVGALVASTRNLAALALVRRHVGVGPSLLDVLRHGLR